MPDKPCQHPFKSKVNSHFSSHDVSEVERTDKLQLQSLELALFLVSGSAIVPRSSGHNQDYGLGVFSVLESKITLPWAPQDREYLR